MTVQFIGAVFVALSLAGLLAYGVRRFFLELLAGDVDLDGPHTRAAVTEFDEDDHGLSWRMRH